MIEEEPHFTIEGIANHVDLSSGTVHEILSLHLDLRKVCFRWVPHLLSDIQKKARLDAAKSLQKIYGHCNETRLFEICTGMKPGYGFHSHYVRNRIEYVQNRVLDFRCFNPF